MEAQALVRNSKAGILISGVNSPPVHLDGGFIGEDIRGYLLVPNFR